MNRTKLPMILTLLAGSAVAATGGIEPNPLPVLDRAPAEVKVAVSGHDANFNNGAGLPMVVTVFDKATGAPVQNLAKTNFLVRASAVNGVASCTAAPVIGQFYSNVPGVYVMFAQFPAGSGCTQWQRGQQPVAVTMSSTHSITVPNSPLSYEGRTVETADIR